MRQTIELTRNWRFHLGEADLAYYKAYDDRAWQPVTIPHDWSVGLPFDQENSSGTGYLPGGVGWYRRTFTLPEGVESKRVFVTFGGVYQHARCWVNSYYLGMRPNGYIGFRYELTGRVSAGENVLCVRAEHLHLADSRWFTGAGIYRDVTLTIVDEAHIQDVYAYTVSTTDTEAEIAVTAQVTAGAASFRLMDTDGGTVAAADGTPDPGDPLMQTARIRVHMPRLWSPESPALYRLCCVLTSQDEETDEVCLPFGIRTFRFDANGGFFLNGANRKLKGVCLHHDAGALGAAVPETVWADRLGKLKAAGCNAVRFAHNPADPAVLTLCDRLGLMVIEEAFDEWEGCKNKWWQGHNVYPPKHYGYSDDFPQWYERDLADMVLRDRSHPSIILWSIGNEIDYPNDPYVHPAFQSMTGNNDADKPAEEMRYDPNRPDARRLPVVARELTRIVKACDASRPVTLALAYPELSNLTGLSDTVDVAGYNYMEALYEKDHAQYPDRIILGSENSVTPEAWMAVKNNAFIAGQFLWTGADFLGEALGWPVRVSTAGLLTTANDEKPLYYHRKALWTEGLCTKLAASRSGKPWEETFGWHYEPGEAVTVSCYTNAETASLFINSRALGTVDVGEGRRATWRVPFSEGSLHVECARGRETAEDTLFTAGAPVKLSLSCDRNALPANGRSVATVRVTLTDINGVTVTDADEPVCLQIAGDMTLLGIENGDPKDLTAFQSPARPTWHGHAAAYLRAGVLPGEVLLTAWTRGGLRQTLRISLV